MENIIPIDTSTSIKLKKPKGPTKVGIESLDKLGKFQINWPELPEKLQEGIYSFKSGIFDYDFLYKPSNEKRLFIFLSGDAQRKKYTPPVFQRWTWANIFPGHCLYIADPTTKLHDDLGLTWYTGTHSDEVIPSIVQIIKNVSTKLNIPLENVILYGSSGGGFAALQVSALIPESISVVINPQIDITKYEKKNVERYLNYCFKGLSREEAYQIYPSRFSILPLSKSLKDNRIFYIQNRLDTHHYEVHLPMFAEALGLNNSNNYMNRGIETLFFEHPKGHGVAEPIEVINLLINRILTMTE